MKLLRNTLFFLMLLDGVDFLAQSNKMVMEAFSKSYDYESIAKYEAAINSLIEVYNEKSYEINYRLGWLYYAAGKHKESVSYYQKAMAIMPAATEPKWAILSPLAALENNAELEKTYLSILKLDPKNALANYNLGLIYYYRKDYFSAKKYFDVSLNLNPFNYNYLLMSAWANYSLGNKNDALILFNKTLLYNPNDKSALEGISLIK